MEPLVGRDSELSLIHGLLAREHGLDCLIFTGDPAIGKSTLFRRALVEGQNAGRVVLAARPSESETGLAYLVLADLLNTLPHNHIEDLPPLQRRALGAVLLDEADDPGSVDIRTVATAMVNCLRVSAAQSPILLAVDDAQWVDASSARVIEFVLRRLPHHVVAVLTARHRGQVTGLDIGSLASNTTVTQTLPPLNSDDIRELVRQRHSGLRRNDLDRIAQVSGGSPGYAMALAGESGPIGAIPDSLNALVRKRIDRLDGPTKRALLLVSASSRPTLRLVDELLGPDAAALAVDQAVDAGVLAVIDQSVQFTHPLLAAGTWDQATPMQRRTAHADLADVVEDDDERARHLISASTNPAEDVLEAVDLAAARLGRRAAPAAAAHLLKSAIDRGADTPLRLLEYARWSLEGGDADAARQVLDTLSHGEVGQLVRAEANLLLATYHFGADNYALAAVHSRRALDDATGDPLLELRAVLTDIYSVGTLGDIAAALELVPTAIAIAEKVADPILYAAALATSVLMRFLVGQGVHAEHRARARELLDSDSRTEYPAHLPIIIHPRLSAAIVTFWIGDIDSARKEFDILHQQVDERGDDHSAAYLDFFRVVMACWAADFPAARLIALDADRRSRLTNSEVPIAHSVLARAMVAAYDGDLVHARKLVHDAIDRFERCNLMVAMVWVISAAQFIELSAGDPAAAVAVGDSIAGQVRSYGYADPSAAPFAPDAIEALIAVGRLSEAESLTLELETAGHRLDRAWAIAMGARSRALLTAARGDIPAAGQHALAALAAIERIDMPFERARTLLVIGQIERRHRRKKAAHAALTEAADVFRRLRTPVWCSRAESELERTGYGAAGRAGSSLSPTETRIAEMAAHGSTNREIAAALFISPKTVESNMSRVYQKLGIHSRAELGGRLSSA